LKPPIFRDILTINKQKSPVSLSVFRPPVLSGVRRLSGRYFIGIEVVQEELFTTNHTNQHEKLQRFKKKVRVISIVCDILVLNNS